MLSDEWQVVGITLDPEAYWAEAARKQAPAEANEPADCPSRPPVGCGRRPSASADQNAWPSWIADLGAAVL